MSKIISTWHSSFLVGMIMATLLSAAFLFGGGSARAEGQTHTINIINNCSADSIYVGAVSQTGPPVVVKLIPASSPNNPINITTLGGWGMKNGDKAVVTVPIVWTSATIWARTGCTFDSSTNECNPNPISDCCDTGGCISDTTAPQKFGLNCVLTGNPPLTLAEFSLQDTNGIDTFDVSMVSGSNVAVKIEPDTTVFKVAKDNRQAVDPSGNTCANDAFCRNTFGASFPICDAISCETSADCVQNGQCINKKCSTTQCVQPFYCGNPGCTDGAGCAAEGFTQSIVPTSPWGATACTSNADCGINATCVNSKCVTDFALNEKQCPDGNPVDIQYKNAQNTGPDYVGCMTPQKFCGSVDCKETEISCGMDNDCVPPATCNSGICTGGIKTSTGDLWGCSGANSGSCFSNIACSSDSDCVPGALVNGAPNGLPILTKTTCTSDGDCAALSLSEFFPSTGEFTCDTNSGFCVNQQFTCDMPSGVCMDPNCCGCPKWADPLFTGISECISGDNPEWHTEAEPIFERFHLASPVTYSFPFDDITGTFICDDFGTGKVSSYTVTFCPGVDGS